jgi:hypothetical protein
MIQQIEEQHAEDEDRFRKLQLLDTSTLNDRLDTLTVSNEQPINLLICVQEGIYFQIQR